MIQQTSLNAYWDIEKSGKLNEQEALILGCYQDLGRPATDLEISKIYRIPINIVTGRRNGLVSKGRLCWTGHKRNPVTSKNARLWWLVGCPIEQKTEE